MLGLSNIAGGQIPSECLLKILKQLALALPLDESAPYWENIFSNIDKLSSEDEKSAVVEEILKILSSAGVYEKTTSFWPFIIGLATEFSSLATQAKIYTAIALTLAQLGQLVEAQNFLTQAVQCAREEEDLSSGVAALVEIAGIYRELGSEKQCRDIFEMILSKSEISGGRKIKQRSPYHFVVQMTSIGLEDLGRTLAEKILLNNFDTGDETPLPTF